MRLHACYHPKFLRNTYTQEYVLARCGKCPACINARAAQWVQRLDYEISNHPFTFFVTLQYDEYHVPQMIRLRSEDNPYSLPSYIDNSTGVICSLADLDYFTDADIEYCNNTKVLIVQDITDFQKFIKRLRTTIKRKYNANFRYFAAPEYGPTTFRSHYHCLFFLDSSLLAKDFAALLSECWRNGNVFDPHIVSGSASQYVAAYVNSVTHLPKIYLCKPLRPKALFSKCPPIGFTTFDSDFFKRIFDKGVSEFTLFFSSCKDFRNVSLWRSIQTRVFPRIIGFDRLSHYDRVALYRLGERTSFRKRKLTAVRRLFAQPYWIDYGRLFCSLKDRFNPDYPYNYDALNRFISIILQVHNNCHKWSISIEDYVIKIEKFYEDKKSYELREWYELQDEYFKSHPLRDFLLLNPNICYSVHGKMYENLSDAECFYLDIYWPTCPKDKPIILDYRDCYAYKELKHMHDKIHFDSTKQKKANDYLLANKDKFNNIITYNQTISDYEQSEII